MAHQPTYQSASRAQHAKPFAPTKENIPPGSFMKGIWENVRKNSSQPGKCQLQSNHHSGSSATWKEFQDSEAPTGSFGHMNPKLRKPSPSTPPRSIYVSEASVGLEETKPRHPSTLQPKIHLGSTSKPWQQQNPPQRATSAMKHQNPSPDHQDQPILQPSTSNPMQTSATPNPQTALPVQSSPTPKPSLLQIRLEHLQSVLAKKDLEIASLKRQVTHLQKSMRGVKMFEGGAETAVLEVERLQGVVARMGEMLRAGATHRPGVLGLIYRVEEMAWLGEGLGFGVCRDEGAPGREKSGYVGKGSRGVSRERGESRERGRSKSKETIVRPCTVLHSKWNQEKMHPEQKQMQPAFDFDELSNWVPKAVHGSIKSLVSNLGVSNEHEKTIKSFVVSLNQSFIQKEKCALESCVQLCQKEIKDLKKQLLNTEVIRSQPATRHKTDRQAFMEGASWILTRIREQFKKLSVLMDSVLSDLDCTPRVLMKALVFATEGVSKMHKKLEKYKDHIDLEQTKEAKKASRGTKYTSIAPKTEDNGELTLSPPAKNNRKSKLLRAEQSSLDHSSKQKQLKLLLDSDQKAEDWAPFDANQAERDAISICLDSDSEVSVSF